MTELPETPTEEMILVIAFDVSATPEQGHAKAQEFLNRVKPLFADHPEVQIFGAIRETANAVVKVLEEATE